MPALPPTSAETALRRLLAERVAIIDGAMGTTIRSYNITEEQARGDRFKDAPKDLKNNGDIYSLTRPSEIGDIHRRFLEAGADIIETNTFGTTSVAQRGYARRMSADVVLPSSNVDVATARLARVRAKPVVWVASRLFDSLIVYGWLKDWSVSIPGLINSTCSLEVEGLV